jgi:Peptidase inhibitor family I36
MAVLSRVRRVATLVGCAAALGLGGLAAASPAVATPATTTVSTPAAHAAVPAAPQGYARCAAAHFCMYSGFNGTGTQCQWQQPSVRNTANACSFVRAGAKTKSVFNRTNHRVQYYKQTNFQNRVGSTAAGARGSLQGTYTIWSFQPQ